MELAARFWTFAKDFYRHPDGTPTSSLENYRTALRPLKRLYGSMLVSEFGPLCLKAMRTGWVQQGLSRKTVNELWSLVSFLEPQNQMMRRFSIIYVLPSMLTGFAAYGLLSLWRSPSQSDGELHCRRCDHILRGLSEPRCPECGEAI